MSTLPAKLSDTAKNPFVAITTVGIALIFGIVAIARRLHK